MSSRSLLQNPTPLRPLFSPRWGEVSGGFSSARDNKFARNELRWFSARRRFGRFFPLDLPFEPTLHGGGFASSRLAPEAPFGQVPPAPTAGKRRLESGDQPAVAKKIQIRRSDDEHPAHRGASRAWPHRAHGSAGYAPSPARSNRRPGKSASGGLHWSDVHRHG